MSNTRQSPLTKEDLLSVVTPLINDAKTEVRTEIRRLGVLMEQMNGKIDTALEAASLATDHDIEVKSLDERVGQVETDVLVLKTALIHRK